MAGSTCLTLYVIYTSELIALQGRRKISESNDADELHYRDERWQAGEQQGHN